MSKNKKKADDPSRTFLLAEIFKSFNRHPNTLYNYKQLTRIIKPAFTEFLRQTKGPDASMDDINGELKKWSKIRINKITLSYLTS